MRTRCGRPIFSNMKRRFVPLSQEILPSIRRCSRCFRGFSNDPPEDTQAASQTDSPRADSNTRLESDSVNAPGNCDSSSDPFCDLRLDPSVQARIAEARRAVLKGKSANQGDLLET